MKGIYFRGAGSSVPVEVRIEGWELRFEAGGVPRTLRLEHAKLELGGDQNAYLVGTFPGEPEEVLYLERDGLLAAFEAGGAPAEVLEEVRGLVTAHRRRWVKTRALIGSITGVMVLLLVTLLLSARALLLAAIPPSWEATVGDTVYESLEGGLDHDVDPALEAFVRQIGARLLAARPEQPYEFEFHVVRDETVNAFALPGGTVIVHTGLIADAGSPEEVAGVLGHELSHVLKRHSLRAAVDRLGTVAILGALLGDWSQVHAALSLTQLKFSRDHETEADATGARLLYDAGIDPSGMPRFFARLAEEEGALASGLELLSTHPVSDERRAALESQIERLPPKEYEPLDVDWPRLEALAGGSE